MEKIEVFKEIGFSEYEAKALSSLIKLKSGNAKQVGFDSGVPQNKLYSIFKKFQQLNLLALTKRNLHPFRMGCVALR